MPITSAHGHELAYNTAAASVAGAIQITIFNPLDCLRIRWQASTGTAAAKQMTFASFAQSIVREEGWWRGLHSVGLGLNQLAVGLSQGLRIGLYPTVRDAILVPGTLNPTAMAVAGLISGSLAYVIATPLWLLKTRTQVAAQLKIPVKWPRSVRGYWIGCSPLVMRGALLTAGQMAGYDATKKTCTHHALLHDGPVLHAAAAIVAGLCASSLSAPADVVWTRLQSSGLGSASGEAIGVVGCVTAIAREGGPGAFYAGWTANVLRLAPTFVVGSAIYEQARCFLGLGYMR